MVIRRFAYYMIESVIKSVEYKLISETEDGVILGDLVRSVFRNEVDKIRLDTKRSQIIETNVTTRLFYAPFPLDNIAWELRKYASKGSIKAKQQLHDINNGIIRRHEEARDYSFYDDFIDCIKTAATVSNSDEGLGFFNYWVDHSGLKNFDEKEVDTRIVISAVDAFHDQDIDAICIISSDQDFVPLHERAKKSKVRSYQADVSKFATPSLVGRRIKSLADRYIPVSFDPTWPMRALCEASGHDIFNGVPVGEYIRQRISDQEFTALCQLHNDLNDQYHLEAVTSDGHLKVEVLFPKAPSS
jgi:uncharacterized LabA/DUF88 family protein